MTTAAPPPPPPAPAVKKPPPAAAPDVDTDDDSLSDAPSSSSQPRWVLGFLAPPEGGPPALLRHRFPSKLGGRPAWLDPVHVPAPSDLACAVTGEPLDFLLQVYAPVDGVAPAFHRVLYVFVSPAGNQLHRPGAVRAFRCQLPRDNPLYPPVPAGPGEVWPRPPPAGWAATATPDRWRVLEAEAAGAAGAGAPPPPLAEAGAHLYPEMEIVVEDEESSEDEGMDYDMGAAAAEDDDGSGDGTTLPDDPVAAAALADAVEAAAPADARALAAFSAAVARAPSQVLRYCFAPGARPVWPRATPAPPSRDAIPPCPRCGGPRAFELHVLPQVLACLGRDAADPRSPDFAAAAVWSCAASCPLGTADGGSVYAEEYVWVQAGDGQE